MEFISISIDIVNSTHLKSKVQEICTEESLIEEKTKEIFNYLLDCEKKLYSTAYKNGLINHLYMVKSIGDELWYLIDIENLNISEKKDIVQKIINSLQEIARSFWNLNLYSKPIKQSIEKRFLIPQDIEYNDYLKNKITVDIINSEYNFTSYRISKLNDFYKNLLANSSDDKEQQKKYRSTIKDIAFNLNMGHVEIDEVTDEVTNTKFETRYDLIGTSVDRFFRISKKSIPGLVSVGDILYQEYLRETFPHSTDKNNTKIIYPIKFPSVELIFPKGEFKGITEDYKIHYLPIKNESYHNFPEVQDILSFHGFLKKNISLSDKKWFSE